MHSRHVVVLGAGVAGLGTALALARDGHEVTLLERDSWQATGPEEAAGWTRAGISHFIQPHQFIPGARKVLLEHFPDVYTELIRAGAYDVDLCRGLTTAPRAGDADLQHVAVRRPLIEWALRRAARAEARIQVIDGANVLGLILEDGACRGVMSDGGQLSADVVVDALGRRSPVRTWLAARGVPYARQQRSECGAIYFSRYYRVRPGRSLPDGRWLLGPRGDLGYMGYAGIPGDSDTFAIVLTVPTGVSELKSLRHEAVFEAVVARVPTVRTWADPEVAEPITPVLPMGGLQNVVDEPEAGAPRGLHPVGDSRGHTDPVLAHGMAFALMHAVELAHALRDWPDEADAGAAYVASTLPALRERFAFATELDEQRLRMWTNGPIAFDRQDGDYALFSVVAGAAVAMADADVLRMYARRMGLLESTRALDDDSAMRRRIEERFRALRSAAGSPEGPERAEMVALIEALQPAAGSRGDP